MTHEERHLALVAYLKMKVEEADWHGVSDAANDLRVLEARDPSAEPLGRRINHVHVRSAAGPEVWCMACGCAPCKVLVRP